MSLERWFGRGNSNKILDLNMNKSFLNRLVLQLALVVAVVLPEVASAQQFVFNATGDVLAGFRKMTGAGGDQGNYELVVNLGNVTNLLNVPAGSTITLSNVNYSALTNTFFDTVGSEPVLAEIQWSAFAAVPGSGRTPAPWVTPLGPIPAYTLWFTLPSTAVNVQSTPPSRIATTTAAPFQGEMSSVGSDAVQVSGFLSASADNTPFLVVEPISYPGYDLTATIGSALNASVGNFGSGNQPPLPAGTVENITPNPFTSSQREDFYMLCPTGTTNPITGSTTDTYFVGYFLLNPDGSETFTAASANTAPMVSSAMSITGTNGFSPLTVVFTNTTSGSITNWVWNFGNGNIITNTTGGDVTNTYTSGGSYTVTLTVYGIAGSSTITLASYIVASPTPKLGPPVLAAGKLVFGGSNCPANVQYRIFSTTNISLPFASWTPVYTNTFLSNGSFSYTNPVTPGASFFQLVSP